MSTQYGREGRGGGGGTTAHPSHPLAQHGSVLAAPPPGDAASGVRGLFESCESALVSALLPAQALPCRSIRVLAA